MEAHRKSALRMRSSSDKVSGLGACQFSCCSRCRPRGKPSRDGRGVF